MKLKTFLASLENLRTALDFIEEEARLLKTDDNLWKIRLASEEVISNIINHGKTPNNIIEIFCGNVDEKFHIIISDYGLYFDPVKIMENDFEEISLKIIQGVMDEVRYERIDDKNRWILIKKLHAYC